MSYETPTELVIAWLSTTGSDYYWDCQAVVPSQESDEVKEYFVDVYYGSMQFQKLISEDEFLDIDWDIITEFVN